jgi:hypothetical protein
VFNGSRFLEQICRRLSRPGGIRANPSSALRASGDPIAFFCAVLADERAPDEERKQAAQELLPYYHPELTKLAPLMRRFLL